MSEAKAVQFIILKSDCSLAYSFCSTFYNCTLILGYEHISFKKTPSKTTDNL